MIFENDARYTTLAILSNLPDEQPDSIGGFFEVYTLDEEQKAWNKQSECACVLPNSLSRRAPLRMTSMRSYRVVQSSSLPEDFYQTIWQDAFYLGESFRCLDEIWRCDGEALGGYICPNTTNHAMFSPLCHLLDACVQLIIATVPHAERQGKCLLG
jgi:hypothetical protein